jgi:DNA mismatch endonuclease (patch repair protein)
MAAVRGVDTKPEMMVRRGLHARGFRFRLHQGTLPGRPDLVLPKHRAVIFVNGCFWHGHDCALFVWPRSRDAFWREKITKNVLRDRAGVAALLSANWRVCTVWECTFKGKARLDPGAAIDSVAAWLSSAETARVIEGRR